VTENAEEFKAYATTDETSFAFFASMPCGLSRTLSSFEKLLVIRIFKPDRVMFGVQRYLEEELGSEYAHSPISSMPSLFAAADSATPIIFVLSQGVDPTWQVQQHAERQKVEDSLFIMSLGQGQEAKAARLIEQASYEGSWVLL
jgi:dynein heavy chain